MAYLKKYGLGYFLPNNKRVVPTFKSSHDYDSSDDSDSPHEIKYRKASSFTKKALIALHNHLTADRVKEATTWLLDSAAIKIRISFTDISFIFTIFVIFAPDVAFLTVNQSDDYYFEIIFTICFYFFIAELFVITWTKTIFRSIHSLIEEMNIDYEAKRIPYPKIRWTGYFLTFFWVLDLVVIISMFPDVPMVRDGLHLTLYSQNGFSTIGRIIRLVRLFRILRGYRILHERYMRKQRQTELLELIQNGHAELDEELKHAVIVPQRTSKLGTQLSSSTTNRVIILILLLLLSIPLLIYEPENQIYDFSMDFIQSINMDNTLSTDIKDTFVTEIQSKYNSIHEDIIYMNINPLYTSSSIDNRQAHDTLRSYVIIHESSTIIDNSISYVTQLDININNIYRLMALYSIILTIVIGVILLIGNIVFTLDTQNLVLKPIERMMQMVEAVAKDPLSNVHFDHDMGFGSYETNLLEKTFVKIAGLLRVGFGEAGAGIIKSNLSFDQNNTNTAIINPLLPGIRVFCIVGFCDIHQFEYCTQQLERDVFTFVNTVAAIVHENVHYWDGSCNKNLGNAFVVIWRIGDETTILNQLSRNLNHSISKLRRRSNNDHGDQDDNASVHLRNTNYISTHRSSTTKRYSTDSTNMTIHHHTLGGSSSQHGGGGGGPTTERRTKYQYIDLKRLPGLDHLAAKALISYLKIIAEINKNKEILQYRYDDRLTNHGRSNFKVQMGFGLHAGWAIEGAVGSLEKVDATYLSPHVNMSARLETSSRQYDVPLLASQMFYDLLSPYIQKYCRKLDVVTVKGSEVPIGIYTYDCLQDQPFSIVQSPERRISHTSDDNQSLAGANNRHSRNNTTNNTNNSNNNNEELNGDQTRIKFKEGTVRIKSVDSSDSTATNNHLHVQGINRTQSTAGGGMSNNQSNPNLTRSRSNSKGEIRANIIRRITHLRRETRSMIHYATNEDEPEDVFERDTDLIALRRHITEEFTELFTRGVNAYVAGDWQTAKKHLEDSNALMMTLTPENTGDGPSKTLLAYMESYLYLPPSNWEGYRPLTSK